MLPLCLMLSSIVMLPLCLMFLTFFLSLGGSFSALMMRAAAEGTTVQVACLFCTFSCTVTFRPFQSPVALAMSSPTFLGDRPRGPTFGAREEAAPTSPPTALRKIYLISLGSNLGPIFQVWKKVVEIEDEMQERIRYLNQRVRVVDEGNVISPYHKVAHKHVLS